MVLQQKCWNEGEAHHRLHRSMFYSIVIRDGTFNAMHWIFNLEYWIISREIPNLFSLDPL